MKRVLILFIMVMTTMNTFSQITNPGNIFSDWKVSAGVMVVPQMGIDLQNPEPGFANRSSVFAITSFTKGANSITPFYKSGNRIGVAYFRNFSEKYGGYIALNKSVTVYDGYVGLGVTHSVGTASVFVEMGSSWKQLSPGCYVGVLIPFKFPLN